MQPDRTSSAATVDHKQRLKEYAVWGGKDSTYQWALEEIERLGDALVVLLHAVEDYGLDAAFGDEKFKAVVAAREAVRRAT